MPIIEVNHVTKKCKPGRLTSLKQTALDDIAIGADSVSNAFVGAALAAKTGNWCLTQLTHIDPFYSLTRKQKV